MLLTQIFILPCFYLQISPFMSNSHGLVPFGGRWQFSRKSIHSLSAIFRIPAGANFAATRIGCRSFQGNFNADLRFVQDFPSSNISSNHCLFGHQLKSTFSTRRNTWDQNQTFKDANSSSSSFTSPACSGPTNRHTERLLKAPSRSLKTHTMALKS